MKYLLSILMAATAATSSAQDTLHEYYTYSWKRTDENSAYFHRSATKTGKLWHVWDYYTSTKTLQMEGYYSDDSLKIREGTFTYYYPNGNKDGEGQYVKNRKEGSWREYSENNDLTDTCFYIHDIPVGTAVSWRNGSMTYIGKFDKKGSGKGTMQTFYETGAIESEGSTSEGHKKDGVWIYKDISGVISMKEYYNKGKLVNRECYNELGQLENNSCEEFVSPKPAFNYSEYLSQNIKHPFPTTDMPAVTVVTRFSIDKEGNIGDIEPNGEADKVFEEEVIRVLSNMPKWEPGSRYNRKVKIYMRLPITFKSAD